MLDRTLLALLLLFGLPACGARWQAIGTEAEEAPEPREQVVLRRETVHGHRDFSLAFDEVWNATIEAVHVCGIAVPRSARVPADVGTIDVEELWVVADREVTGRVCVRVGFRGVSDLEGVQRAERLLDELERRLADRR